MVRMALSPVTSAPLLPMASLKSWKTEMSARSLANRSRSKLMLCRLYKTLLPLCLLLSVASCLYSQSASVLTAIQVEWPVIVGATAYQVKVNDSSAVYLVKDHIITDRAVTPGKTYIYTITPV